MFLSQFVWQGCTWLISQNIPWKKERISSTVCNFFLAVTWFHSKIPNPGSRIHGPKSKIAIYLCLGLYEGRPSYRRSLNPSIENILHFKPRNFFTFSIMVGNFFPRGSGFHNPKREPDPADRNLCESMRIRIHITAQNTPKIYFICVQSWIPFPNPRVLSCGCPDACR